MGEGWKWDAVDWFAELESGRELDDVELSHWNRWSNDPRHRAEYAEVVGMTQTLRRLPPPSPVGPGALRRDFKALGHK